MAIEGREKRAQQDEAIQATPPQEELRVGERRAIEFSNMAQAELERSAAWRDPDIFDSLAKISIDVHNTRRESRENDFQEFMTDKKIAAQELRDKWETTRKLELGNEFATRKLRWWSDLKTMQEDAKRDPSKGTMFQRTQLMHQQFEKEVEEIEGQSPYLAGLMRNYGDSTFGEAFRTAIGEDAVIAERRALYNMESWFSSFSMNLAAGRINTLDEGITTLTDGISQYMGTVSDNADQILMNKGYQMLVLTEAKKIEAAVKAGSVPMDQGMLALTSLQLEYARYNTKGKDLEGNEHDLVYFLDEGTMKSIDEIKAHLDEKKQKANAVYTWDTYKEMVDYDKLEKGDFTNSMYVMRSTLESAEQDYRRTCDALMMDMGAGNESAHKQLLDVSNYYWNTVRPTVALKEICVKSLQETGDISSARRDVANKIVALKDRLQNPADDLSNVTELTWRDKSGTVYLNMGYPTNELRYPGEAEATSPFNYYKSVLDVFEKFQENNNLDTLASYNRTYNRSLDKVKETVDYSYMVKEDPEHGIIAVNQEGVANLAKTLKEAKVSQVAASGGGYVKATSDTLLGALCDRVRDLDGKQRMVYLKSIAAAYVQAGQIDALTTYKMTALTKEQQSVAQDLAMWTFLNQAGDANIRAIGSTIYNNTLGGAYKNVTIAEANSIMKNNLANTTNDLLVEMNKALNAYNVPEEFRPALRHTMAQMAVASVLDKDGKTVKSKFDTKAFTDLVSANFEKSGVYKFSSAVGDSKLASNTLDDSKKMMTNTLKNFKVNKSISTKVNNETGRVEIYENGQPFLAHGEYGKLRGTGLVPFDIDINPANKPAGMPVPKFQDANSALIYGATVTAVVSGIDTNADLQKYLTGKNLVNNNPGSKMTAEEYKKTAIMFANVMGDPEAQKEWVEFYNNNYKGISLIKAPKEYRDMFIASAEKGWFSSPFVKQDKKDFLYRQGMLVDFMYTRMSNGKTLRLDIPEKAEQYSMGFPVYDIASAVANATPGNKWQVTSTTSGTHARGSLHYAGRAVDIGFRGGWNGAMNGNKINERYLSDLYNNFLLPNVKNGNIDRVLTSYNYLLPDFKQAWDGGSTDIYKKIRTLKNNKGDYVFQYAKDHSDHFHVEFAKQMYDAKGRPIGIDQNKVALDAEKMLNKMNGQGYMGYLSQPELRAMARMGLNYKPTRWDAKKAGRNLEDLSKSPMSKVATAAGYFGAGKRVLGSSNMAFLGMYGYKFRLEGAGDNKKLLKLDPDRYYTMREIIDLDKAGIRATIEKPGSGNKMRWVIEDPKDRADKAKREKLINEFIKAGK